jgi:hypothetical protein
VTSRGNATFWQLYRGLSAEVRAATTDAYKRFRQNPAHPGLQLERLRRDPRLWAVRVTRDHRAVARRCQDDWVWIWIGSHKDFDRQFPG